MDGLHRRPVPTTHVVKWPWWGPRRLSGDPVRMRTFACAAHAAQLQLGNPHVRAYRYRVVPAETAMRLSARRVGRALRRYLDLVDRVVDAIPDAAVEQQLSKVLWEDLRRQPGEQWRRLYQNDPPPDEPVPGGGWCAPADITCRCGVTDWPHLCTMPEPTGGIPELAEVEVMPGGVSSIDVPLIGPVDLPLVDVPVVSYYAMMPRSGPEPGQLDAAQLVADVQTAARDLRSRMQLAPDAPVTLHVSPLVYRDRKSVV